MGWAGAVRILMGISVEPNLSTANNLNFDYTLHDFLHVKSRLVIRLNLRCYSDQALLQLIFRRGVNHLLLNLGIVVAPEKKTNQTASGQGRLPQIINKGLGMFTS